MSRRFVSMEGLVRRWNRLLGEVEEPPTLEVFKRGMDVVLREMV